MKYLCSICDSIELLLYELCTVLNNFYEQYGSIGSVKVLGVDSVALVVVFNFVCIELV